MSSIKTNYPAVIAQNSLRRASLDMDTSLERLSSGKRINSGSDDPAGLSVGRRLESSAVFNRKAEEIANTAISMVQGYRSSAGVVVEILSEMRGLAIQAGTDAYNPTQRIEIDNHFNALGQEWARIAAYTQWNGGVTKMDTFSGPFILGGTPNQMSMTFKSWDPTNATANQNAAGASAAAADDANAGLTRAWNFSRTLNDVLTFTNARSQSHVQSQTAARNAVAKLDVAISNATGELAKYTAYISRLEHAANNSRDVATEIERGQSRIMDADYARETIELTRAQIVSQAATAMLAQANQTPQMLLELLR